MLGDARKGQFACIFQPRSSVAARWRSPRLLAARALKRRMPAQQSLARRAEHPAPLGASFSVAPRRVVAIPSPFARESTVDRVRATAALSAYQTVRVVAPSRGFAIPSQFAAIRSAAVTIKIGRPNASIRKRSDAPPPSRWLNEWVR